MKYIIKMYGPDATPPTGEELYGCESLDEVIREIEFQRTAFPDSSMYCTEKQTGKWVDV